MTNKKIVLGSMVFLLIMGMFLTGCATLSKENHGTFANVRVPAKDFTALGLVFTENKIENKRGEIFTYYALLKEAKALGADAIVNVTIDVKHEGTRFLGLHFNRKETWYGSATAIKYTAGPLKEVRYYTESTPAPDEKVIIDERIIMNDRVSTGASTTSSSGKKWYNPFTWFRKKPVRNEA